MSNIANRKNVILTNKFTNGQPAVFDRNILLDFVPDELIVRYISYLNLDNAYINYMETDANIAGRTNYFYMMADESGVMSYIYSDLVNDTIGCIANSPTQIIAPTYWTMGKQISGSYNFKLIQSKTGAVHVARDGALIMHLEFVKYK